MRKSTTKIVPASEGPLASAEADLDEVVSAIRRLAAISSLQLSVSIGELVVQRFFGGDLATLRSRGPKDESLRRLAEHPNLPFGPSTLSRHVAVYEVIERIGGLQAVKSLTHSHVRHVLGAPANLQAKLLAEAERRGWTADQLRDHAQSSRPAAGRGGRRPTTVFEKGLSAWRRAIGGDGDLRSTFEAVEALDATKLESARVAVEALQEELTALAQHIALMSFDGPSLNPAPVVIQEAPKPKRAPRKPSVVAGKAAKPNGKR